MHKKRRTHNNSGEVIKVGLKDTMRKKTFTSKRFLPYHTFLTALKQSSLTHPVFSVDVRTVV